MSDLLHRITDALLASELVPAKARMRLMRAIGYDVDRSACIWAGATLRSKKLKLGKNVFINVGFFFDGYATLEVGDNVRMGQYVRVITATHKIGPREQRCLIDVLAKPITIGAGSWIGCNVTLLPGANIAPGCVIGAGSVVTKPTLPDGVYVGAPARLVRFLTADGSAELPAELALPS